MTFDYGNNIRAARSEAGVENAFDFPGFVPAYIRPLFCEGKGPFRGAALSGDPDDIARHRPRARRAVPRRRRAPALDARWPREQVPFQGLPARICWLGYGERARAGLRFNELVASGEVSGADRHRPRPPRRRLGRLPNRETEAMRDGSDAIADWPILNALVNTAAGATWVSVHHGGGVGIGYSPARRHGRRRRRHARSGRAPRARPDHRPRAWASFATPTPATSARSRSPTSAACASRCGRD